MALTFADYLEALDDEALAALLTRRRDVCAEAVPRDLERLADRLCTATSLFDALAELDRDALEVARAAVVLGRDRLVRAATRTRALAGGDRARRPGRDATARAR